MEKTIILHGLTPSDLKTLIEKAVEEKVSDLLSSLISSNIKKQQAGYITRSEVCSLLRITLTTLHQWTKDGRLHSYKIGSRVLYKSSEVETSVISIKFKREYHLPR